MSAKVDAERREDARREAVRRANEHLETLKRVTKLFEEGLSLTETARRLEVNRSTVLRWRQVLKLDLNRRGDDVAKGRLRDALRRMG